MGRVSAMVEMGVPTAGILRSSGKGRMIKSSSATWVHAGSTGHAPGVGIPVRFSLAVPAAVAEPMCLVSITLQTQKACTIIFMSS